MALALPLGQSALSSVIYKLWGSRGFNPSRVPRSRDGPFVRKTTDRSESTRQGSMGSRRDRKSYRSWVAADGGSAKKDGGSGLNFGGWDELDKQAAVDGNDFTRNGRTESHDKLPRRLMNGKLSRRRSREKPLFLRLLTVVFPFLGSWTRFFM
ncbi:hypothetical protein Nepgr_012211 [Nepenthes gracilis]|uniref:Uncharacterized protein n=1 Tax=Nepenthes gracilis TaxID=150966 RepID=A0AAD3SFC4_NEPGR|nr:hypothetical protein Nepgr_012211 [Nepenthes gracilis]